MGSFNRFDGGNSGGILRAALLSARQDMPTPKGLADGPSDASRKARWVYRRRRDRDKHFARPAVIFGEPGFDILLTLFVAHEERRTVSITDAMAASAVPATTALRWIAKLIDQELAERTPDPFDSRSSRVRLTTAGAAAMRAYLNEW